MKVKICGQIFAGWDVFLLDLSPINALPFVEASDSSVDSS